jgi:hypothetical protein
VFMLCYAANHCRFVGPVLVGPHPPCPVVYVVHEALATHTIYGRIGCLDCFPVLAKVATAYTVYFVLLDNCERCRPAGLPLIAKLRGFMN